MPSDKKYNPVDLSYRGVVYYKHNVAVTANHFLSDTPCSKCGEYLRKYGGGKKSRKQSYCIACHNKKNTKNQIDNKAVERRRAIEAHQQKQSEEL